MMAGSAMGGWLLAQAAGYRPFLDPLDLHDEWFWTMVPLLALAAMAYKGVRVPEFTARRWAAQSGVMALQLALLMAGLAVGLHVLVEFVLPLLG